MDDELRQWELNDALSMAGLVAELRDTAKVPLHPDLAPYVRSTDVGFMLQHPLVYQLFYLRGQNERLNAIYAHKTRELEEAAKDGRWKTYVMLHERPYRLWAFMKINRIATLIHEVYWDLVGMIWQDSENIWQETSNWEEVFTRRWATRHLMMDEGDKEFYDALPGTITVYRGWNGKPSRALGWSWTTDWDKAMWFSNRFEYQTRGVSITTVAKEAICGVMTGRGESEVIIQPHVAKEGLAVHHSG